MQIQQSNSSDRSQQTLNSCITLSSTSQPTPNTDSLSLETQSYQSNSLILTKTSSPKTYKINSHQNTNGKNNHKTVQLFWKKLRQIQKNKSCNYCNKHVVNTKKHRDIHYLNNVQLHQGKYSECGLWVAFTIKLNLNPNKINSTLHKCGLGVCSCKQPNNSSYQSNNNQDGQRNEAIKQLKQIQWKYYSNQQCQRQLYMLIHYYRFLQYIPVLPIINISNNHDQVHSKYWKHWPYIMLSKYRSKINIIHYQQIRKQLIQQNSVKQLRSSSKENNADMIVNQQIYQQTSQTNINVNDQQDSLQLSKQKKNKQFHNEDKSDEKSKDSLHQLLCSMENKYNQEQLACDDKNKDHEDININICKLISTDKNVQLSNEEQEQQEEESQQQQQSYQLSQDNDSSPKQTTNRQPPSNSKPIDQAIPPKTIININYFNNQNKKYSKLANNLILGKKHNNIYKSFNNNNDGQKYLMNKQKSKRKCKSSQRNVQALHVNYYNHELSHNKSGAKQSAKKQSHSRNKIRDKSKKYHKYFLTKSFKSDKGNIVINAKDGDKLTKIMLPISSKDKKKKVHGSCGNLASLLKHHKNKNNSTTSNKQIPCTINLINSLSKNKQIHTQTQHEIQSRTNQNNSHRTYTVVNSEMLKPFSLTIADFRDYLNKLKNKIHEDKQQLQQEQSQGCAHYVYNIHNERNSFYIQSAYPSSSMSPAYNYNNASHKKQQINDDDSNNEYGYPQQSDKTKQYNSKIYITNSLKNILTNTTSIPSSSQIPINNTNQLNDNTINSSTNNNNNNSNNIYYHYLTNSNISDEQNIYSMGTTGYNFNKNKKQYKNNNNNKQDSNNIPHSNKKKYKILSISQTAVKCGKYPGKKKYQGKKFKCFNNFNNVEKQIKGQSNGLGCCIKDKEKSKQTSLSKPKNPNCTKNIKEVNDLTNKTKKINKQQPGMHSITIRK